MYSYTCYSILQEFFDDWFCLTPHDDTPHEDAPHDDTPHEEPTQYKHTTQPDTSLTMGGPPAKRRKQSTPDYSLSELLPVDGYRSFYVAFKQAGNSIEEDILHVFEKLDGQYTGTIRLEVTYPGVADFNITLVDIENLQSSDLEHQDYSGDVIITPPYSFGIPNTKFVKKYHAYETWTPIIFGQKWFNRPIKDIDNALYRMFSQLLAQARTKYHGEDKVRFYFNHPNLEGEIGLPMLELKDMTPLLIMDRIQAVLQSHENLPILKQFVVHMGVLELPRGSGYKLFSNYGNDTKCKTSTVKIKNVDNLCMGRAIVVCLSKLDDPLKVHKQVCDSRGRKQLYKAIDLYRQSGVPTNRMSNLHDLTIFEDVLNVRIIVIGFDQMKRVIYPGNSDYAKVIFLSKREEHFDAIISITGFMSKPYFCLQCVKCFNKKHSCKVACLICKSSACTESENIVMCQNCNMSCRSQDCFERHVLRTKNKVSKKVGMPPCEKFWKCLACKKVLDTTKRCKDYHKCGEWYCNNCEMYIVGEHKCYMRQVTPNTKLTNYIFYDIETMQESGVHIPNYIVAHKVCKFCLDYHM